MCLIEGCYNNQIRARGLCPKHYERMRRLHQLPENARQRNSRNYVRAKVDNGSRKGSEHVALVEKILGKILPKGVQIHHIDGNPSNNSPFNLIVCPNQSYHRLIHRRQEALEKCGNVDYSKCSYCKEYDAPENLSFIKMSNGWHRSYHKKCAALDARNRWKANNKKWLKDK